MNMEKVEVEEDVGWQLRLATDGTRMNICTLSHPYGSISLAQESVTGGVMTRQKNFPMQRAVLSRRGMSREQITAWRRLQYPSLVVLDQALTRRSQLTRRRL